VVRVGLAVVVVAGVAAGLWWAAPRSSEIQVLPPTVCSYKTESFDRVALVTCEGQGKIYGIANRSQTLIPASEDLGASGSKPVYVTGATDRGVLRISKGWFGSTTYSFVAADGTVTELKETGHYIGGVTETLK
jgi:hypothetical protein